MELISEKEMMKKLDIGKNLIIKLRRSGLPHIILGEKLIRYDYDKVIDYITKNEICNRVESPHEQETP